MTPAEISIEASLNVEIHRFYSDWLFKWHGMTYEGGNVDVEDFRGGRISYAGIYFEGQQQTVFWQAIDRYLTQKVHSTFKLWESETQTYSLSSRRSSIDGVEHSLDRFATRVLAQASDTARRVSRAGRAGSISQVERGHGVRYEASRLAAAHRTLIDQSLVAQSPALAAPSHWTWIETFYAHNKGLIWLGGVVIASSGTALHFLMR